MERFRRPSKVKTPERAAKQALPILDLPLAEQWRQSLILPHLTQRFALLRDEETGALVTLDKLQSHLRAQRHTGRLTEDEERAVMHEFRLHSVEEASRWHSGEATRDYRPQTLEDYVRTRAASRAAPSESMRIAPRKPAIASRSTSLPDAEIPVASTSRLESDPSYSQLHRISRVLDEIGLELGASNEKASHQKLTRPVLRSNDSQNLTLLSPAHDEASDQGSIYSAYMESAYPRTPTTVSSQGPIDVERASDGSSQSMWSPLATRFPQVPARQEEGDRAVTQDEARMIHRKSGVSVSSTGSSYESEEGLDGYAMLSGGGKHEPFEFDDPSAYQSRETIRQLSLEVCGGLDLSEVAMIQAELIRRATRRANASESKNGHRARSDSLSSLSDGGYNYSRFGASTPASQRFRLEHVEETDDELLEQMDTPVLDSASHSPSVSSHDAHMIQTPPHISAHGSAWDLSNNKPPVPAPETKPLPPAFPQSSLTSSTSSRAAISNPSYVPGRRFPPRSSSADQNHLPPGSPPLPLHEQIAAQAEAATAALRQMSSPLTRDKSNSLRRSKSSKSLRAADIGSPQLISTSANLSKSAVRDLPSSPPPVPMLSSQHQGNKSDGGSSGLRSKMARKVSGGKIVPPGPQISPFELPPGFMPQMSTGSAGSSTPGTPSTTYTSPRTNSQSSRSQSAHTSPRGVASPDGQSNRAHNRFRRNRPSEGESPRGTPPISPPLPIPGQLPVLARTLGSPLAPALPIRELVGSDAEYASRASEGHPTPFLPTATPLGAKTAERKAPKGPQRESDTRLRELMADLGLTPAKIDAVLGPSPKAPRPTAAQRTSAVPTRNSSTDALYESSPKHARQQTSSSIYSQHTRLTSEGGSSVRSGGRSVSERIPTPPPDAATRRQRRSQDRLNESLPQSPLIRASENADSVPGSPHPALTRADQVNDLAPDFTQQRGASGYASSFFDAYDEREDRTILAEGSITAAGDKRLTAGDMPAAMLALQNVEARVEVDEMQDGSLFWQVVRKLRTSESSDSPMPMSGFHSRQASDTGSIHPPAPSAAIQRIRPSDLPGRSNAGASDLKLLVRRQRQNTGEESLPRPASDSDTSVHVYEADKSDVNALVDELINNGEAGSLDLIRQRSVQRVMARRREASNRSDVSIL